MTPLNLCAHINLIIFAIVVVDRMELLLHISIYTPLKNILVIYYFDENYLTRG